MSVSLTPFQRAFQALMFLLTGLVILLFIAFFGSRLYVDEQIRTRAEAIASDAAGLSIEIGQVRGAWWSGLTLSDVTVHGGPEPNSPVLARVPLVQVNYTVLSFFSGRPRAIRIDLYHPDVKLVMGKNHLLNLLPRLRAPQDEPPLQPTPPVDMVFHNAKVAYTDNSARKPFTAEVGNVSGQGHLQGYALTLDVQGLRETDLIHAHATYELKKQQGDVHAWGNGLEVPYWLNRFAWAPEYRAVGGKADADVHVSWQDPMIQDEIKLSGHARVYDGEFKLKNVALPIAHATGDADFTQDVAHIHAFSADIDGMPLQATGEATRLVAPSPALGMPDPGLDLRVTAPAVDIGRLEHLFPGLKSLELSGAGVIVAHVTGTAQAPLVAMRGLIEGGRYGKQPVGKGLIICNYQTGRLDLPHFQLRVADGSLEGNAYVGLPEGDDVPVPYRVAGSFAGLDLKDLLAHNVEPGDIPPSVRLTGRLAGEYDLKGVGAAGETQAAFRVTDGDLDGDPIHVATARYQAHLKDWSWPEIRFEWGSNQLLAHVEGRVGQPFKASLRMPQGELAQLVKLSPEPPTIPMSGRMTAEAELSGRAESVASWLGKGVVTMRGGLMDGQRMPQASADLQLADNRLGILNGRGTLLDGDLRAHGEMVPFLAPRGQFSTTQVQLSGRGILLKALSHLPPRLRGVAGSLDTDLAVTFGHKSMRANGTAHVASLRHPEWGHLEDLAATLAYDDQEGLRLLPLTWRQGRDVVTASGLVRLTPTPWLDLRLQARQVDVATLFGAVYWPEVVRTLNPRALPRDAAPSAITARAGLPGHESFSRLDNFDFSNALAHWTAWRKLPLDRPPPAPTVPPFWERAHGQLSFNVHVTGPGNNPAVSLTADGNQLDLFDRRLDEAHLRMRWADRKLSVPMFRVAEAGHTVLTAGGAMSDRPADHLVVRTYGLDLGWSDRALRAQKMRLAGHADMLLRASGPWTSPRLVASAELDDGSFTAPELGTIPYEHVGLEAAYERGMLAIQHAELRQNGHTATLTGRLPVGGSEEESRAPLDLALRLDDDNLAIANLFSQGRFQWLGGKGFVELKFGGTPLHPTLAGQVHLHDGRFSAKGLDSPVEDFNADLTLTDEAIDVKSLHGRYGGGDVDLFGEVFLDQFRPDRFNLTALAKPFKLQLTNDYYQGTVEANLHLTGPVTQPALSGTVALRDGTLRLKDDNKSATKPAAEMPPLRLSNLNVSLGPNLRLKNALIDLAVTTQQRQGYLTFDGSITAPKPRGVVIIEGGTIRPLNNPFKIVDGRVEFLGENVQSDEDLLDILGTADQEGTQSFGNSKLDITAQTVAYDYNTDETVNITSRVTGSLEQMEMRFSSEPIRSEQEILDILSKKQVLAGTFGGRLDGGQVIVNEVGGLVSSNIEDLISPYTLSLRNMLNLQTLRFELVTDYQKSSLSNLAGFKPALLLETRPLWERVSLGSRLVAGELYDTTPTIRVDNTYVGLNLRLNRNWGLEYRIEPYIDESNQRSLNHVFGLKAQLSY